MTRMSELYTKNPNLGDAAPLVHRLAENQKSLDALQAELAKFQVSWKRYLNYIRDIWLFDMQEDLQYKDKHDIMEKLKTKKFGYEFTGFHARGGDPAEPTEWFKSGFVTEWR